MPEHTTQPTTTPPSSFEQGKNDAVSAIEGAMKDPGSVLSGIQDSEFGKKASAWANDAWERLGNLKPEHWFGGLLGAIGGWLLASLFGLPGWFNLPVMAGLVIGGGYLGISQFGEAMGNWWRATSTPQNYQQSYNNNLGQQPHAQDMYMNEPPPPMYGRGMAMYNPQVQYVGAYPEGYFPPAPGPQIPTTPYPGGHHRPY